MGKDKPFPCIDDILHFKGKRFKEHMAILNEILKLLAQIGMQVSTDKSHFCQKSIHTFLGTINFIKNHIKQRAVICKQINRLTQKDGKFVLGKKQKNAFNTVKTVISEAIMLEYPNPNHPFDTS
jgi:hypothetical protein